MPRTGLFGPLARELIYLGQGLEPAAGIRPVTVVDCPPDRLAAALTELRACVTAPTRLGGELAEVAARLRRARYPVVVWAAAQFPGGHGDLLVGSIAGLLRELNATGRCAGLPLAGPDNVVGANQVCAWQTGVPLRTSFAGGAPDHDPLRWNGAGLLASGMADALLWLGSLRELPVPEVRPPTVALLRPGGAVPGPPVEVLIPVGVPGLDHAGSLFRTDGVVAVPVRRLRETALPTVAEVLRGIAARLAA
jgi:formylmethanofuran dehydrogenase subunit B